MTCPVEDTVPEVVSIGGDNESEEDIPDLVSCDDEPEHESIYFKYAFDGCKTIEDVIHQLDYIRNYLQSIKDEGHNLLEPIDSGHCILTKLEDHH
jgi:hypothetical protein